MLRANSPDIINSLDVFASGQCAGALYRSEMEEDTFLFSYAPECRAQDAVSLTMPVVRDPYDSMSFVHPVFEMNLPEGALLEKLRLLFAKTIPDLDSLGLLALIGQSQIGRLRYTISGTKLHDVPEQSLTEILTYTGAHDLFNDLLQKYASYSGISGVQPKVLLRAAQDVTQPPLERLTHRGATHIVKSFDAREYPELAANEFFCMQASHSAGIPTANVQLSSNRSILVVERFDLRPDGSYLGLEDFCVLSGMRSHGRYQGSYELVARRIREFVSPEKQPEALQQLFMMLALSCAVENGDAHLKNFAVLYEHAESAVQLAPAYDLVSTTPYLPRDVLALTLAGSKRFPDRKRLLTFGQQACGLSPARSAQLLEQVFAGVQQCIVQIQRLMQQDPSFTRAGEHFINTFKRAIARLES